MNINKPKIEKFGQELALLAKNFIEKEGLSEWIEGINPTLFKIERANEYKFLSMKDKQTENSEPEQNFAIEFLVFIIWAVSYTVQQIFSKKNVKPKVISGLNPHLEMDWVTKESTLVLDIFYREIYKWLEEAWNKKDLSVFEKFINVRHQDYYNSITDLINSWGIETPLGASGILVKIIEEKSKQNWIEKLKKPNNKEEVKNIIINRYFNRIFEDMQRLVKGIYNKTKLRKK